MRQIEAKVLLSHVKQPDPWFGLKYNMNLYRGCMHRCIYCDSRSECYGIDNFDGEVLVKANAIELLRDELSRKRIKGNVGTGSMNDPYMPLEREVNLTGRALAVLAEFGFPVHVMTKSDLVLRDTDTLVEINKTRATVSFTITTADDALAAKVEPGAPPPSARFRALETLAAHDISVGVTLMPVLPFIEDTVENVTAIVTRAVDCGASYVIPSFGVTLRDRQRLYYYGQLDKLFPGMVERYRRACRGAYFCPARNAERLEGAFEDLRCRYGFESRVRPYRPLNATQLSLF